MKKQIFKIIGEFPYLFQWERYRKKEVIASFNLNQLSPLPNVLLENNKKHKMIVAKITRFHPIVDNVSVEQLLKSNVETKISGQLNSK